eukprot:362488-Chlamydomonas_euryale.AAC.3
MRVWATSCSIPRSRVWRRALESVCACVHESVEGCGCVERGRGGAFGTCATRDVCDEDPVPSKTCSRWWVKRGGFRCGGSRRSTNHKPRHAVLRL